MNTRCGLLLAAFLGAASGCFAQITPTVTMVIGGTPSGTGQSGGSAYFYTVAEVQGPGSSSFSRSASCSYYVTLSSSRSGPSSVTLTYTVTDYAWVYYYLRGSSGYQTSGSVTQSGQVSNSAQTITENPGTINQAQTTQTNTLYNGPTALSDRQLFIYGPLLWSYNGTAYTVGTIGVWSGSCTASAAIVAPTYSGNTKANDSEGYGEDDYQITGVS